MIVQALSTKEKQKDIVMGQQTQFRKGFTCYTINLGFMLLGILASILAT